MTYKEARTIIECELTNMTGEFADREMPEGIKRLFDALEIASKELGRAEKYKWHDLRKNPEDLPDGNWDVVYLCLIKTALGKEAYDLMTYKRCEFMHINDSPIGFFVKVIKWKEIAIEEFEVEE